MKSVVKSSQKRAMPPERSRKAFTDNNLCRFLFAILAFFCGKDRLEEKRSGRRGRTEW
jgi:hypothetical protein